MQTRRDFGTEAPSYETARRVSAILQVLESRDAASALGVSETTILKVALGREVHRGSLQKIEKRLGAAEQRAETKWLAEMKRRTRARPVHLSGPDGPVVAEEPTPTT